MNGALERLVDELQLAQFVQLQRQHHGQGGLVELQPAPVDGTLGSEVLRPVPVGALRRGEEADDAAGVVEQPECCQREAGLGAIAGPDEVVAARIVVGESPRSGEAGHDRSREGEVFVHLQHHRAGSRDRVDQVAAGGQRGRPCPLSPALGERGGHCIETLHQRSLGEGDRAADGGGETDGQFARGCGERAGEGDVAVLGACELPRRGAVPLAVLPTVGRADVAGARARETVGRDHRECLLAVHRLQHAVDGERAVVVSAATEVRGDQHVQLQWAELGVRVAQRVANEHRVAAGVAHELERELVALVTMHHRDQRHGVVHRAHGVVGHPLHLGPEPVAAHQEAQVAQLRTTGGGPEHLVEHAAADGGPHPARTQRGCHRVLVAGREGGVDAGLAERNAVRRCGVVGCIVGGTHRRGP